MIDILQFEFMQNALLSSLLVSIICGIIGTLIVINRMVFIAGGLAHGSYGGVGLALYLGIAPMLGATLFALTLSFVIALLAYKNSSRIDAIIGALWAFGMAFGIILSDLTPGYNVDLMSYLFGAILSVSSEDLMHIGIVLTLVCLFVCFYYQQLVAMSFDMEFAKLRGVPTRALYFILVALIALCVVVTIRAVGLILVIALLSIPPYIAEKFTHSIAGMMAFSTLLSALFSLSGIFLSYMYDLSSGATIIAVATTVFFMQLLSEKVFKY
ncbi:MAG: metal ABC transporter permease [Sulfurospirillaceae bacterium]|nr:metal ABC transporter permease [Sulfurospirillaceae bacterium]